MRRRLVLTAVLCASLTSGAAAGRPTAGQLFPADTSRPPIWASEFDGRRGSAPDPRQWTFEQGPEGWGDGELQAYTDDPANAALDGRGHLRISAVRADAGGGPDQEWWTSARLSTRGRFAPRFGRIEARILVPRQQGVWPAFWMLGDDIDRVGWPACGEIDVMEALNEQDRTRHSVHGPRTDGEDEWKIVRRARAAQPSSGGFHVYAVDWRPGRVQFLLDGVVQTTVLPRDLPPDHAWVFDKPFHLLLNVAVGGAWSGPPDATTESPASMLLDWVRVYR